MAAFEIPRLRFSGIANAALKRRRFVIPTSDTNFGYATSTFHTVGVTMNDPAINEVVEIADGIVMVEAGEPIAAGQQVEVGVEGIANVFNRGIAVGLCITGAGAAVELATIKMY